MDLRDENMCAQVIRCALEKHKGAREEPPLDSIERVLAARFPDAYGPMRTRIFEAEYSGRMPLPPLPSVRLARRETDLTVCAVVSDTAFPLPKRRRQELPQFTPGVYRHHKTGGIYQGLEVVWLRSEAHVLYQSAHGDLWLRPYEEFLQRFAREKSE